jgi:dTDP-4-amino-4,6-dideoxygalactose transaminase
MPELAVNGGPPVRTTPFPAWPEFDDRERARLLAVLDSRRWWATEGTATREFEEAWGAFHGTPPAVACTNGTHAIELLLSAAGVGEGDEVIVPDWSFLATISAVLTVNAVPVLVDVDLGTGCIDPALAEAAITERTRALIAVHIAGHPADMGSLTALCRRHEIALLEDCAHAHGSTWEGRPVGTFGAGGSYSFQASKLMTAGEGGAVVSADEEVLAAARSFGDCGRRPGEWFYRHYVLGGNYRMTEWQAAVLLAQLERFPEQQARRNANAVWLNEELAKIPGIHPQVRDPRTTSQGNYCYVVRVDPAELGAGREEVRLALGAEGIPLTMSYPPLHQLELFASPDGLGPRYRSADDRRAHLGALRFPVTERLADETLWFKTAVLMGDRRDCQDVVDAVAKVATHVAELGSVRSDG